MSEREDLSYEAAFLTGKCCESYRARGGAKRSPLPDFFIGAHAAMASHELLTRDVARYRSRSSTRDDGAVAPALFSPACPW